MIPLVPPQISSYISDRHKTSSLLQTQSFLLHIQEIEELYTAPFSVLKPAVSIFSSKPAMQPTHSHSPGRPQYQPTNSSTHTAIIVGVIIGALGILAIILFVWDRRQKQGVKRGFRTKSPSTIIRSGGRFNREKDQELETGIIHEPLPVYQRDSSAYQGQAQPRMDSEPRH